MDERRGRTRRAAFLAVPALAFGGLLGAAISQHWIPVWLGVGGAVAAGITCGAAIRRWRRQSP
jgi:hypothetical protein